ncbi:MAG: hypothetical protein M1835_006052 [Candelina submexicana]|nr:MAG: hypothetical protein M1835_006052 [Candelina submexicana]
MPSPTKDYDQAEAAVGQAFKDLVHCYHSADLPGQDLSLPHYVLTRSRGEDHATSLENNLSGFEKKVDALLGSIDEPSTAERHAAADKETKEKAEKESTAKKDTTNGMAGNHKT